MKIEILLTAALSFIVLANSFAMEHKKDSRDKKQDCAVNEGPCIRKITGETMEVTFAVNPRPVKSMEELLFSITLKRPDGPVTDAKVTLDLTMPGMFMGVNRPVLKHRGNGRYEGKGVLPVCPHGGKLWKAVIGIEGEDERTAVGYVFGVQ